MKRKIEAYESYMAAKFLVAFGLFSALAVFLVIPIRGLMNIAYRIDFMKQRLDDYPSIYENYVRETDEWWEWWQTEDYQKRADGAAFIYQFDDLEMNEEEKLNYICEVVGADAAAIVNPSEYETLHQKYHDQQLNVCWSDLSDGRRLVLGIHSSIKQSRIDFYEKSTSFLNQFEAGLPGYVVMIREGETFVAPSDAYSQQIAEEVNKLIQSGGLNYADLKKQANNSPNGTAMSDAVMNITLDGTKHQYACFGTAYASNDDFVIAAAEGAELARFGRKRSWSLCFLTIAIGLFMTLALFRTMLYRSNENDSEKFGHHVPLRGLSAFLTSGFLLFMSILFIQLLSNVNQSAQAAQDEAVYLSNYLKKETERHDTIVQKFDLLYEAQAESTARILSDNPRLINTDSLNQLNGALGSSGLCVYDENGLPVATNDVFKQPADNKETVNTATIVNSEGESIGTIQMEEKGSGKDSDRLYRHALKDASGKTFGYVELCVPQSLLDRLVQDTEMKEVIGDMHIIDTLHVAAVEIAKDHTIAASTYPSWVGDPAEEHGISTVGFTDGYEGIVNFGGNKCYSVVFGYGDTWMIVGSEDVTPMVFMRGVLLLFGILLVTVALYYLLMCVNIYTYQKEMQKHYPQKIERLADYPPIWNFMREFMVSVAVLSVILYITTNGNPTGLTYNMVRGTWVRGVSVVTVTTSVMLVCVVFTAHALLSFALSYLGRFLSPKGKTILGLIDSASAYIGAIVLILYTLTMFGVNTTTLIGGVGATALVFTLGANSLIADVVSGLFIIFEDDFSVGDIVVIRGMRGVVTEISMRTTKLMDDNSQDIHIISNSEIKELINQSRENSTVMIDLAVSHDVGIREAEIVISQVLAELPKKFPKIIGVPQYWGVAKLPEKNAFSGKIGSASVRIAFCCLEKDREMLTYEVYRYLVRTVHILQDDDSVIGTADPKLSEIDAVNTEIETRIKENKASELDRFMEERRKSAGDKNAEEAASEQKRADQTK
ncbi:MAG: mechanosensitive ion channel [Solobacterium sp.]|nr:mechanosensitive ion channel [Solobacterium sp.]